MYFNWQIVNPNKRAVAGFSTTSIARMRYQNNMAHGTLISAVPASPTQPVPLSRPSPVNPGGQRQMKPRSSTVLTHEAPPTQSATVEHSSIAAK